MPCSRTQHSLTGVGLNPRPLDPESEALTTRPPRSLDHGYTFSEAVLTYPQSMFSKNYKNIISFHLKIIIFIVVKYRSILHGHVIVMHQHFCFHCLDL